MNQNQVNDKMSSFFKSFIPRLNYPIKKKENMIKTAILGSFTRIHDPEELMKEAKMTSQLLELPKYQTIINRMRGSIGILNIVHHDGYRPLIELMLKKAFPADTNDIFKPEPMGDDYFVSASYFIKEYVQGQPQFIIPARNRLEALLNGSKTKITREWLKTNEKFTDQQIRDFIGPVDEESLKNPMAPCKNPFGRDITLYETTMENIRGRYDPYIDQLTKEIKGHESGTKLIKPPVNPEEEHISYADKKRQRDRWIVQKRAAIDNLNNTIGARILASEHCGVYARDKDGLSTYNPQLDALSASRKLMTLVLAELKVKPVGQHVSGSQHIDSVLAAAQDLKTKLEEYHPASTKIRKIKDLFLSYLGEPDRPDKKLENYDRYKKTIRGDYTQLQSAFSTAIKGQSKVVVLDDFEKSALCFRDMSKGSQMRIDDDTKSVFANFMGQNEVILEADDSGQDRRGGRVIVILSSEPVNNLPDTTVIDLSVEPVDHAEAEVIVRNILGGYTDLSKRIMRRKMLKQIDDKIISKEITDEQANKERRLVKEQIDAMYESYDNVEGKTRKNMVSRIQGLNQKQAITVIREILKTSLRYGEEVLDPDFDFDEDFLNEELSDRVNKLQEVGTIGLVDVQSNVKFENYSYRTGEDSPWGLRVPQIGLLGTKVRRLTDEVSANEKTIAQINMELKISAKVAPGDPKKLDNTSMGQKIEEKKRLLNRNANLKLQYEAISSHQFPHFYILWGQPGTGKSVWPEALADLLGLRIKSVDMGSQRNKWVGDTEANCRRLFNTMRSSKDMVFLFDEIDKQVESGASSSENTHETTKHIMSALLSFFDNTKNEEAFVQNNVYFVMTTNELEGINRALVSRAEVQEVKLPNKPEDYKKFFDNNFIVERRKDPTPWFIGPNDVTAEDGWRTTQTILDSLDWKRISEIFAARSDDPDRQVDFRTLKQMLIEMWRQDASYRISLESIGLGDKKQRITGVPLTTENIIEASEFVHTTAGGNNNIDRGFLSLAAKKSTEVNKILEPYFSGQKSWETEKYMDPLSGKEKIRIKLPDDVNRIMKGESKVEEEGKEPEGEFVQEKDPETGRMKTVWKPKKTPTQKMKDLEEKGFERKPIVPEEEEEEELTVETPITRISPEKEKENSKDLKKKDRGESTLVKEENMGVQSSTDYVYDYLNKQGFISDKGKLFIPHKTSKKINKIDSGIPEISNDLQAPRLSWANVIWDDNGIATFHNGFTMVAPRW